MKVEAGQAWTSFTLRLSDKSGVCSYKNREKWELTIRLWVEDKWIGYTYIQNLVEKDCCYKRTHNCEADELCFLSPYNKLF